jgi:hypothetical protein
VKLFKAELRRILRRRLTMVFGILALAGLIAMSVVMWAISSTGPSEAALAEAQAEADAWNADNPDFQDCMDDPEYIAESEYYSWAVTEPEYAELTHEERCETYVGVTAENYIWTYTFSFEDEAPFLLIGVVVVAGLIMMMLASSAACRT